MSRRSDRFSGGSGIPSEFDPRTPILPGRFECRAAPHRDPHQGDGGAFQKDYEIGRLIMCVKVLLIGTLNTKGKELAFLRQCIEENGGETIVVDGSSKQSLHLIKADYPCEGVAEAAGSGFQEVSAKPKAEAARIMARGASQIVSRLIEEDKVDAVVAVGGGSG